MVDIQGTILVVDDDPKVRKLLVNCFEPEGFRVLQAESGSQVDACLADNRVDLITLDLNLGPENGLNIASRLKASCDIPIIIVTGKGDVIDKVVGLEMGADDYISKPFHVREVIARVRSVLRRTQRVANEPAGLSKPEVIGSEPGPRMSFDGWVADFSTFELKTPDGTECELTSADFRLLKILLENPKRVLSREQIMNLLNGLEWTPYDRTIDNQIARLRKKIEEDPSRPKYIKTVRGIGYTFAVDVSPA